MAASAANGIDAGTPAGAAASRILLAKASPVFDLEPAARGGDDMDAVHDMRVASRRAREALRLFAPLYRKRFVAEWDAAFRHVTRALGLVRDADVYIDALERMLARAKDADERATLAYLIGYRQGVRVDDLRRMRKRLEELDLGRARKAFEKAASQPRDIPAAAAPLGTLAASALEPRIAAVFAHVPAVLTAEDSASQHEMRIACKKLRYAVETFEPCFGDGYVELRELLVRFQDELGALHDLDVFLEHLRALRSDPQARDAHVTGAGLRTLVGDLEARRVRQFRRVSRLVKAEPEAKVRERFAAALPPEV